MFSYKVVLDFCDIHMDTAVKEPFYIKAGGQEMQLDQKRDSVTGFLQLILQKPFCGTPAEAHLESSRTNIYNGDFQQNQLFLQKSSIVDIQLISQYASDL